MISYDVNICVVQKDLKDSYGVSKLHSGLLS